MIIKLPNDVNSNNHLTLKHENEVLLLCSKGINLYVPIEFIDHNNNNNILSHVHPLIETNVYIK